MTQLGQGDQGSGFKVKPSRIKGEEIPYVYLCACMGVLFVIMSYVLQLKSQSTRLCIMNAVCDQYYS